jgi:NAD-dependent DNA ligase
MLKYFLRRSHADVGRDDHGQPVNPNFNKARLIDRGVDELIGLCKGIVADNVVAPGEAVFLADWLRRNSNVIDMWPANLIAARIEAVLCDGEVNDREQKDLFALLSNVVGDAPLACSAENQPTKLPFDNPLPEVAFARKYFCFTGKFYFGTREQCQYEAISRGGSVQASPTNSTDYLVVGTMGSAEWIHSTHGRKIESAVELRRVKGRLAIIPEKHWAESLFMRKGDR